MVAKVDINGHRYTVEVPDEVGNDRVINLVFETTDYAKLHKLNGNRDIGSRKGKIIKSIEENGFIPAPILLNEKMEKIDGQARSAACEEVGIPIIYTCAKGLGEKECTAMNAYSTNWGLEDYVRMFASQGYDDYIRLLQLSDKHPNLPLQFLVTVSMNNWIYSGDKWIKRGEFVFKVEETVLEPKLIFIEGLKEVLAKVGGNFTCWAKALNFCYEFEEIDNKRLKAAIMNRQTEMRPCHKVETALDEIEKAYNFRCMANNKVYIYTEYQKYMDKNIVGYRNRNLNKNR